jgi:hypothetical protein
VRNDQWNIKQAQEKHVMVRSTVDNKVEHRTRRYIRLPFQSALHGVEGTRRHHTCKTLS